MLCAGGADRLVKVWNAHTRAYVGKHVGHTDAVNALAVDANLLFSAGDDCTILVWDLIPPSLAAASSLALRRSGGGKLGSARRGEAADDGDGEHPIDQLELAQHGDVSMRLDVHVHIKRGGFTSQPLRVLSGVHSQPITAMAMMPGLGLLASCGLDGLLVYWCYVSGEVCVGRLLLLGRPLCPFTSPRACSPARRGFCSLATAGRLCCYSTPTAPCQRAT